MLDVRPGELPSSARRHFLEFRPLWQEGLRRSGPPVFRSLHRHPKEQRPIMKAKRVQNMNISIIVSSWWYAYSDSAR